MNQPISQWTKYAYAVSFGHWDRYSWSWNLGLVESDRRWQ